ncbi:MAG: OmcA/MtrC family decaheme c-type cytochrome [Acidobacteria bacterium]|nr:OmcA/MtrC family decaheme c-type cytochrome [Acidobacteriota bacterium]
MRFRAFTALFLLVAAVALTSAPSPIFTARDKTFYADQRTASFVRPGLVITIDSATIAADGTVKARVKLTDPRGLPLDRLGITTPGPVNVSFIVATIPQGRTQYVAYTTRVQTSPITNQSETQAGCENNGVFAQVADGVYDYTFRTKAAAGIDRAATHTIGAYGSRNLSEFDMGTNYDDDVYSFVPDGSQVRVVRDVIKTASCNKCHDTLSMHGGSRRSMELCVMCHTPQTIDPDTGNTQDMPVLIHKIHMGSSLPSVKAGRKYVVIGNQQSVHDYSKVLMPPDARSCIVCHEQEGPNAASQANRLLAANRAACGACHDDLNFASGEAHPGLSQVSDSQCTNCHIPRGELELDASIFGAHTIPVNSGSLPGVAFTIERVDDTAAGKKPIVTFTVKDKSGAAILASKMDLLTLVMAGPAPDYKMTTNLDEDARSAEEIGPGTYRYTFKTMIPASARGTFALGIHGFRNVKILAGTKKEQTVRDAGSNKIVYFAVDDSLVAPRRTVVSMEKCNACHGRLLKHARFKPADKIEYCAMCHLTGFTDKDAEFRPKDAAPPSSLALGFMLHRVHRGRDLTRTYATYGTTSVHNFNIVGFPGDLRNCGACHVGGSEQLPLPEGLSSITTPAEFMDPTPPTSAACLGCHDTQSAAAHARTQTTSMGESCSVCHGPQAEFSVSRMHAR